MAFSHQPVMPDQVLRFLAPQPGGVCVDCTVGGGGHAALILQKLGAEGCLVGLDRDPAAIAAAGKRLRDVDQAARVHLVNRPFGELPEVLAELGIGQVDGIVFDLGVSSHQLDTKERGFSYQHDAPLDMRMSGSGGRTAEQLVNELAAEELADIIDKYGEERWARRIASFIVAERQRQRIVTTGQLVEIIKMAIPARARREGPHPARRTFQALRIAVNDELEQLEQGLPAAIAQLGRGGRVVVISFHSLEDRIVKKVFRSWAGQCTCPPGLPVCMCGGEQKLRILTKKAVLPSEAEKQANPRARSARLRAAERI
ncbi:MAG TPA: 16S rRNA (cytosine(1402)-N(4))-methyltransferase RsmH [Firmicutes bacterium]|nr:16S rRNA (cytosine(1402)-N(4))-methyltransferase RsmH [Bacillota bacterium]